MTVGWALDNVDKYSQRFLFLFRDFPDSACLFQPIYFPLVSIPRNLQRKSCENYDINVGQYLFSNIKYDG